MKLKLLYIIFFALTIQVFAQEDTEKKSVKIPAQETKEQDTTPSSIKIEPKVSSKITKTDKNIDGIPYKSTIQIKEYKKEFSMIDNSKLINPGQIFEKKWNDKAVEQGLKLDTMEDQFLGTYKINGEFAHIICRDFGAEDGDMVRVMVNDNVFIPRLVLTNGYKSFKVPLTSGINQIEFVALNMGEIPYNTAEFQVYDDNEVLISSRQWNLYTGIKASIIVTKE